MLLLVCVLEALSLTGITLHEWLGFILCTLVLLHVTLQWDWFRKQFRHIMTPGAHRRRINSLLNIILLIVMAAVLLSGVLVSNQVHPLIGERLGRSRVWNEIHGWLNFVLVLLVGLHLALNWDWIIAIFRRHRIERPALADASSPGIIAFAHHRYTLVTLSLRIIVVTFVTLLAAFVVYATMAPMYPQEVQMPPQYERVVASPSAPALAKGRPQSLRTGMRELGGALLAVIATATVGRFVFRLRL